MAVDDARAAELASLLEIDIQDAQAALAETAGNVEAAIDAISSGRVVLQDLAEPPAASETEEPPLRDADSYPELKALELGVPPCDLLTLLKEGHSTRTRSATRPPVLEHRPTDMSFASVGQISLHDIDESFCNDAAACNSLDLPQREAEIMRGVGRLQQRLERCGLHQAEMLDDGNCLFRACAAQLYRGERSAEHHMHVRRRAVSEMNGNSDAYATLFISAEEFAAYVEDMAKPAVWGDELVLRAIADAYGATVHVITSSEDNWYLVYKPQLERTLATRHLFLSYVAPVHYNAFEVAPIEAAAVRLHVRSER
eukprot:gb/GFBE01013001.1/.p1 GENE.gb/GFBE01013001.1/~~gb/GFBE01013001.1/.p1  ORF type:complete len:312 (+),score=69.57 gb/GFBE01013001.1/:1-936(+)